MGRDSSVGIATRYGIEFQCVARISTPVQTGPGAHPASYTMGTGSFSGVKRPGRGVDNPPPSSTEVEGRVELYVYTPSGFSWPVCTICFKYLYRILPGSWAFCSYEIFTLLKTLKQNVIFNVNV